MNIRQLANIATGQADIAPELPVYMDCDGRYVEVDHASLSALQTLDGLQSVITLHPPSIPLEEDNVVEDDDDNDNDN